jgi:hypothetical protein
MHTYTHTYMHICIHIHIHTHAYIPTYMHTQADNDKLALTEIQRSNFVTVLKKVEQETDIKIHTYTYTYIHKYTHTYIPTYLHTQADNDKLTLTEIQRSNLVTVLKNVEQETDINQILDYFSYEHFYVCYCKFWELDSDHVSMCECVLVCVNACRYVCTLPCAGI